MKFDTAHDYYVGRQGDNAYIISTPFGEPVKEKFDDLVPIDVELALEYYMTYAKGWNTKTHRASQPPKDHDVFWMVTAYGIRMVSDAIANFFKSSR